MPDIEDLRERKRRVAHIQFIHRCAAGHPHDNLMRLAIDDSNQARVLAELLARDGISDIDILSRSDIYGDGIPDRLDPGIQCARGNGFCDKLLPRATDFIPATVSNLAAQVSARSAVKV